MATLNISHAKANGRRKIKKIICLYQEEGRIEGDKNLINYITLFYKNIFGPPDNSSFSLDADNAKKNSEEHSDKLTKKFSLEEINYVVFMAHSESPCQDGFTTKFYQRFCDLF